MRRSLERFHGLPAVVYAGFVLAAAIGVAQIPDHGWQPAGAFFLVVLSGALMPLAYTRKRKSAAGALWTLAAAIGMLSLFVTFLPTGGTDDSGTNEAQPTFGSEQTTPSSPATDSSSPSDDTSTPPESTPSLRPQVKPMVREVDVRSGTATLLYGGRLRLALDDANDGYAVMGFYTPALSCGSLFPDVGETFVLTESEDLAYEVTLLSSDSRRNVVHVEIRRRLPTEFENGCPPSFG